MSYHIRIGGKPYCLVESGLFSGDRNPVNNTLLRYPTNCAHSTQAEAEAGALACIYRLAMKGMSAGHEVSVWHGLCNSGETEASHTPVPWTIGEPMNDGSLPILDNCDGAECILALVQRNFTGGTVNHQHANANLIAASPELLEACKAALGAIDEELGSSGEDEVREHPVLANHKRIADQARYAIAKAKGGAK